MKHLYSRIFRYFFKKHLFVVNSLNFNICFCLQILFTIFTLFVLKYVFKKHILLPSFSCILKGKGKHIPTIYLRIFPAVCICSPKAVSFTKLSETFMTNSVLRQIFTVCSIGASARLMSFNTTKCKPMCFLVITVRIASNIPSLIPKMN